MFSRFKMINAISASILILLLASCSTKKNLDGTPVEDGPVSGVTITADKTETVSGGKINLTAVVQGSGTYNKFVSWKILKGGGKIQGNADTAIYTADLAIGNNTPIEIEATSQGDNTKKAGITLSVKLTTSIQLSVYASDNAWKSSLVPTADIPVVLYDAQGVVIQQSKTDAKGTVTFIGLTPQEYIVTEEVPKGYGVQGLPLEGRKFASRRLPLTTGPVFYDTLSFVNTLGVVTGQVYLDKDFSGIREPKKQNDTFVYDQEGRLIYDEPGVAGAELTLTGTDVDGKPVKRTTKTDGNGRYEIPGLLAGQYTLSEAQPVTLGDWNELSTTTGSSPTSITFSHNSTDRSDSTNQFILPEGSSVGDLIFAESDLPVTGLVYLDRDRDGYRFAGDGKLIEDPVGIPGVTLRLLGVSNSQTASAISDKDGKFIFDRAVPAGKYKVSEDQPLGYGAGHFRVIGKFVNTDGKEVELPSVSGNITEITVPQLPKSGIDPATLPPAPTPTPTPDPNAPPKPAPITTTYPVEFSDTLSNIMGTVFQDDNKDGFRDAGFNVDPGLVLNVPMRLTGTDINGKTVEKTTTLDEVGEFYFADLLQGTYQIVQLEQPSNYLDGKTRPGLIDGARIGTGGINKIDNIALPAGKDAGGTQYWIIYLTTGKILPGYTSSVTGSYSFAEIANK